MYNYWLDLKEYLETTKLIETVIDISFHTIEFLVKQGLKVEINGINFNELIEKDRKRRNSRKEVI